MRAVAREPARSDLYGREHRKRSKTKQMAEISWGGLNLPHGCLPLEAVGTDLGG